MKENMDISKEKLKSIKLIVMDCDGVLTDGGIYINKSGESFRRFDVKDGIAIKLLQKHSISIAWVSGSSSETIDRRANSLGVKIVRKGVSNKLLALESIQKLLGVSSKETMFLGDDINDLTVLHNTSLFIVPSDAHEACKRKASYIAFSNGGKGFVREVTDKLLIAKGIDTYCAFETKNDFEF